MPIPIANFGTFGGFASETGMWFSGREVEFYLVTVYFPAFLLGLIALYLYFRDRSKRL